MTEAIVTPFLASGQTLDAGSALRSQDGRYDLSMQSDGNCVLYRRGDGTPLWATHTGVAGSRLTMQGDGNLVVYGPDNTPLWASGTRGVGGWAELQNTGAFVIVCPQVTVLAKADAGPIPTPSPEDPRPDLQFFSGGLTCCAAQTMLAGTMAEELDAFVALRRDAGLPDESAGLMIDCAGWELDPHWKRDFEQQITQIIKVIPLLRERHIPMLMFFYNSNGPRFWKSSWDPRDDTGNTAFFVEQATRIKSSVGFDGMLVSGMNENDESMSEAVRRGVRQWFAANVPTEQLMSFAPTEFGERYTDTHPDSIHASAPCGPRHLLVSDNGPIVTQLYGTLEGDVVNVEAHKTWLNRYANRGKMASYGLAPTAHIRSRAAEWLEILRHYAAVRAVPMPTSGDDLDLSRVANPVLKNCSFNATTLRAATVDASILSAHTDGANLHTEYSGYAWPVSKDGIGDAICYFFYEQNGTVAGGKFDYWRVGGQPSKSLINVIEHYGGHEMPSRGTRCWAMISSLDGTQRSNTCDVTWV